VKKYVATPGAEVIGSAMRNFFVSLNSEEFLPLVNQIFAAYEVDEIHDDHWYPHQLSLDVFRLIENQPSNASINQVALGVAYVETATFPPEINDIYSALMALSLTYHLNIRNAPKSEGYEVSRVSDRHIQIRDLNPFPHDTVYGFIWGIARRFRNSKDNVPVVHRTFFNEADPDADGALYDVKW
jgi:hypothetical protein